MSAKKGHKIGEVCKLLDLQPYVLRYWETEFRALQSPAGGTGPRVYRAAEVALIRRIKQLLYEEGYTIAGARKKLESEPAPEGEGSLVASQLFAEPSAPAESGPPPLDTPQPERIETLRRDLEAALAEAKAAIAMLDKYPG